MERLWRFLLLQSESVRREDCHDDQKTILPGNATAMKRTLLSILLLNLASLATAEPPAEQPYVLPPVTERFTPAEVSEEPSFQKHVVPLFGRLGCNGRACHGSFQGAGGFQLSLFGYDFKFDHNSILAKGKGRINTTQPAESALLRKPTWEDDHEGGQRFELGSWQHHLLSRWIEAGAKFDAKQVEKLIALEVTPAEILFTTANDKAQLRAVAIWANGTREDVTPLCRFTSSSDQIAKVNIDGLAEANGQGDTHIIVSYDKAVVSVPVLRPVSDRTGEHDPEVAQASPVDVLVGEKLRKLGIVPSELCTEAEFLRRVSLDLAGTLPSAPEVEAFLANTSPNKRSEKIEELLSTPAYAAWWSTKFCDWTGNNDQQLNNATPIRGKAGQEWYDWIYKRVSENMPYDELAAGIVLAESRRPGQSYLEYCEEMSGLYTKNAEETFADRPSLPHYWARNNFRQVEDRAIGFAYTFMGVRIQCAQCHKHPFDVWSKQDFEDFKVFFTRVSYSRNGQARGSKADYDQILKALGVEPGKNANQLSRDFSRMVTEGKTIPFSELIALPPRNAPAPNRPQRPGENGRNARREPPMQVAKLLGQDDPLNLNKFEDARAPLMDWLRSPENPYFAKAFANRVWANYFNVGIVEPPDDMSLGNPPSNKPLLDHLAQGFIEHNFDMKWLHREICNSAAYQRSWRTNSTNEKDERNFSRAVPRRLPAEVTYDAIQRATSASERANSQLIELKDRGIAVASSNANANGGGRSGFALKVFGRSIRESNCDCDRGMEASLLQTVYLQNDNEVLTALNPSTRGTWLAEIDAQLNPRVNRPNERAKRDQQQNERDLARAKLRLQAAQKLAASQPEVADQIARLEARVKQLEKQQPAKAATPAIEPPEAQTVRPEPAALVREAYLRTLSREPKAAELERSLTFLAEANTTTQGLRDLMWALLNTKEFIVNH